MYRARVRPVLLLTLATSLAACSDDPTEPEPTPAGAYALTSVNGGPLPYVAFEFEQDKVELVSGEIVLAVDHTCTSAAEIRITQVEDVSTETEFLTCTWTINENALRLRWDGGGENMASWSGDEVVFNTDGVLYRFVRAS